jgi:hypothetical protein
MRGQIVFDVVTVFDQCIIYIEDSSSRVAENYLYVLLEQALHQDICT